MATFGSYAANATIDIGAAGQEPGTTTNDAASSGNVGETQRSNVVISSPVSMTTATVTNIATISLTAGDWDVVANLGLKYTSATQSGDAVAGISTTSATLPNDGSECYDNTRLTTTTTNKTITIARKRISVSGTTTVYLVGQATFSAGTCGGFGDINARRVR